MSTQPQLWYAHGKSDNVTCMNRDTKWLDNATKPILIFETVQFFNITLMILEISMACELSF